MLEGFVLMFFSKVSVLGHSFLTLMIWLFGDNNRRTVAELSSLSSVLNVQEICNLLKLFKFN